MTHVTSGDFEVVGPLLGSFGYEPYLLDNTSLLRVLSRTKPCEATYLVDLPGFNDKRHEVKKRLKVKS